MHGKGSLVYPNNERYDGAWVYGKRHGCVGAAYAPPLHPHATPPLTPLAHGPRPRSHPANHHPHV